MKKIFIIISLILLVGCSKSNKQQSISMHCNGIKTTVEIREDDILKCKLQDNEYNFIVKKVNNSQIVIETKESGLTDTDNLKDKKNIFKLNKDSELILHTQSTDYQEVVFKWN